MPRTALGYDGDNAMYEALRTKVLADEQAKKEQKEEEQRQRRASLGLPEEEHKSRKDRKKEEAEFGTGRKKSIGEKVANLFFNAGRPDKLQDLEDRNLRKK